ncbi:MAG: cellulase family glycosylhydrolase [Verrucomicrobia bacterium]|nr:cellulase family glycosylhydrolase [Verrucomicrobiota bacterium]OQC65323.1 MAG: Cellulase (glycosyl hydrolase family 5) [Verrucomicrobia bacterium ADurb.Bin006]MDI9381952.1 cellulase family glycosylhydrolase [Verrucomicrobiota bacterium]NMD21418.1 glycoside hydrolase family 5 protein [Verrucomicrobiota bacterium]HNU99152.1 cellulase family glycosylhydrolase [Verrucomicrobiota bacterium]
MKSSACRIAALLAAVPIGFGSMLAGGQQTETQSSRCASEFIRVSKDRTRFVLSNTQREFRPWGFNYDHDASNRLLEDYWEDEWATVSGDFEEMKALGANTVRVHLQVARFMKSATEPDRGSLAQLGRLLRLAETNELYLDVTGLGCYRRKDTPSWYNDLDEGRRWEVQARFWESVAEVCSASPAVFCYDLMNEPVVSEDKQNRDWTPGEFAGMCFVQRLTLDRAGRSEKQVAKAWVETLVKAIRKKDQGRLITVGAIPWALTFPEAKPLFYSQEVGAGLDFVSLHFYPKRGEVDKALAALAVYDVGKPIVIEEMFPLNCSTTELGAFIEGSRRLAVGWLGFYWGKTIAEYRQSKRDIAASMALDWLEYFAAKTPDILGMSPKVER